MGSFVLRMAAYQSTHGKALPLGERPSAIKLGFSTSALIKVSVDEACEEALALGKIGEPVLLAVDDRTGEVRIAVVLKGKGLVGWIPSDDSYVTRLQNGAQYRAHLRRVTRGRGGRKYVAAFIEVALSGGTMDLTFV